MKSKNLLIIAAVGILVGAGLLVLTTQKPAAEKSKPTADAPSTNTVAPQIGKSPEIAPSVTESEPAPEETGVIPSEQSSGIPASTASVPPATVEVEFDFSEILERNAEKPKQAVTDLLRILPQMEEVDQIEAIQHIVALSDDEVSKTWIPDVISGKLPEAAMDALYADLLGRSPTITADILGAISDRPEHPKKQESRELLESLYGAPPSGTTWHAWAKAQAAQMESSTLASP